MECGNVGFFAIIWSLWLTRNEVVFNRKDMEIGEVVDRVKTKSFLDGEECWATTWRCPSTIA